MNCRLFSQLITRRSRVRIPPPLFKKSLEIEASERSEVSLFKSSGALPSSSSQIGARRVRCGWEGVKVVAPTALSPMESPLESAVERFVRMLLITGAWLDEVALGLCAELPPGSYPGEEPWEVVLEMLSGTIGTTLQSAEPCELGAGDRADRLSRVAGRGASAPPVRALGSHAPARHRRSANLWLKPTGDT